MVGLSLTIAPLITGIIHVMANPIHADSTMKIVENGKRALSQSSWGNVVDTTSQVYIVFAAG